MKTIFTFSLVTLLCICSIAKASDLVTITSSKDNSIIQSATGSLANSTGDIYVGRTNQDGTGTAVLSIRRGLVYFDIASNVPSGATIDSVRLNMYFSKTSGVGTNVMLHKVSTNWGEGTSYFNGGSGAAAGTNDVTWLYTFYNATTPTSSPAWTTPGGDFAATVSATSFAGTSSQYGIVSWRSETMKTEVSAWLTDASTNYGWLLQGDESTGQTAKQFSSHENATVANRPILKVYYTAIGTTTGLNSELAASFSTYPNPATDFVNVNFSKTSSEKVYIYNTCGALMKVVQANNEDKLTIPLSGINKGIYLIKVGSQTTKLVVK